MDMQPPPSTANDIRRKAADKAIALLAASGAKYHVKFDDGTEFKSANYDDAPVKGKHKRIHKPGELHAIYMPVIQDLKPGDVGVINIPAGMQIRHIQSAVLGTTNRMWGAGAVITERSADKTQLTVLRVE